MDVWTRCYGNLPTVTLLLWGMCVSNMSHLSLSFYRLSFLWHQMKKITFQLMKRYSGMRYGASILCSPNIIPLRSFHFSWGMFEQSSYYVEAWQVICYQGHNSCTKCHPPLDYLSISGNSGKFGGLYQKSGWKSAKAWSYHLYSTRFLAKRSGCMECMQYGHNPTHWRGH